MKITDAEVSDSRREGVLKNPYLMVLTDENIIETGEPRGYNNWRLIPHGPFFAVDWQADRFSEWTNGDIGTFNVASIRPKKLVEVLVVSPDEEIDLAMDLDRARRLVRKYQPTWRYILDDVAGQHSKLQWRLVEKNPRCIECGLPAVDEVYHRSTYLPLCGKHISQHNRKIQHLRVNS